MEETHETKRTARRAAHGGKIEGHHPPLLHLRRAARERCRAQLAHRDIPPFDKTAQDASTEEALLSQWVASLPSPCREEMRALYDEMAALETQEAQIYKALDKLEAVISHNESDISTWEAHEYDLQLTYGEQNVALSPYLTALRQAVRQESLDKITREGDRRK